MYYGFLLNESRRKNPEEKPPEIEKTLKLCLRSCFHYHFWESTWKKIVMIDISIFFFFWASGLYYAKWKKNKEILRYLKEWPVSETRFFLFWNSKHWRNGSSVIIVDYKVLKHKLQILIGFFLTDKLWSFCPKKEKKWKIANWSRMPMYSLFYVWKNVFFNVL